MFPNPSLDFTECSPIGTLKENGNCICKPTFNGMYCETCIDGYNGSNCDICSDDHHMTNQGCKGKMVCVKVSMWF